MNIIKYIYYRLVKFYKNTFHIEESPGFLIHSCYSWGLGVLLASVCFYFMSVESVILWIIGLKMKKVFILFTIFPFALLHIFSEDWLGDEKQIYKDLCQQYKLETFKWLKGVGVFIFVLLSLPCYLITLYLSI